MKKTIILSALLVLSSIIQGYAQTHISAQPHQAAVTMIATPGENQSSENTFFSAGQDGFLIKWTDDGLGEHYQLSDLEIREVACSPDGQDVAVYETDGGSVNKVSIWNWKTLTRKCSWLFDNVITSLTFSSKGSYVIVGTATVNGLVFIDDRKGSIVKKISVPTGIVSLAVTSATENSIVTYSPAGSITYYDLRRGSQQARFTTEQGLSQPTLFNRNMYLAGVKDDTIYIIQAMTGTTIAAIPSRSPRLLSSENDTDLYYMTYADRTYTLNVLTGIQDNKTVDPEAVKSFSIRGSQNVLTAGIKKGTTLFLGTQQGALYKTDTTANTETAELQPLTTTMYDKIVDISQTDDDFYFLTKKAVFKSSYDSGSVVPVADNNKQTNIITLGNKIILWSKNRRNPVQLIDSETGKQSVLFTPQGSIQTLRLFGTTLYDIESNASVNSFSLDTMQKEPLYTGSGLQDIVVYNGTDLYIAKSAATKPNSALIYINMQTKETVPLSITGTVAYSLTYDPAAATIFGISVSENSGNGKTDLFSFNPATRRAFTVLELQEEDPDAFTMLYYPNIFTNIGKNLIQSYNLQTRKNFIYSRSASLPLKIAKNKDRLLVLNRDGSVSWYNPDSAAILADWYLTNDGQWFEF